MIRLLALGLVSIFTVWLVETTGEPRRAVDYQEKVESARIMAEALNKIKEAKVARGIKINLEDDPNLTGMIGPEVTPITTTLGYLPAKRTAANPNFAAVLVDMFKQAGLKKGHLVAVGFSGSLPALNVAILSAAKVLGLELVIISSVGSSNYGATDPDFTYLDMEKVLNEKGLFHFKSIRASLGGIKKSPLFDLDPGPLAMNAIRRNLVRFVEEVDGHMEAYAEAAGNRPISAFVNVGGAPANLGWCPRAGQIPVGLQIRPLTCFHKERGLIFRMAERGIPIIHLLNVRKLAKDYGLPFDPKAMPKVGDGGVYYEKRPPARILSLSLALLALALFWASIKRSPFSCT